MTEMMSTREVADYLRIKERKVYDLVKEKKIPCTRVTGKWLFPKDLIDQWLARGTEVPDGARPVPPAKSRPSVAAGSHDLFLDWCIRESRCGLALLAGGSLDGLKRVQAGEAAMAGIHILDNDSGSYNVAAVSDSLSGGNVALIHWAWRRQGLVMAPGNPLGLRAIEDLAKKKARVVPRQPEAGSQILLVHLLSEAGIKLSDVNMLANPARTETDLGLAILEGKADAGLAIQAAAKQLRLDFVALTRERFDLVIDRKAYFDPPVQKLLAFAKSPPAQAKALELSGYDIAALGEVLWNGA